MPNWCNNTITITGSKEKLQIINDIVVSAGYKNIFLNIVGLPEGMTSTEYNKEWYDTNVSNWGTKWDVDLDESNWDYIDDCITAVFESAWSPPIPFCEQLAKLFDVEVKIFYYEGGIGFSGECICYPNGLVEDDECEYLQGIYKYDEDTFWCEAEYIIENYLDEMDEEDEINDDKFVEDNFNFVSEKDKEQIINQLKESRDDRE
jgi:hypothetical protein